MRSSQKYSKKEFPLSQYYNQLERYESGLSTTSKSSLKKEYSLNSFSKDPSKTTHFSKTSQEPFRPERSQLGIYDKYNSKTSFQKFDRSKLENIKKFSSPVKDLRVNKPVGDSLAGSNVTHEQWNNQSRLQKQNIPFSTCEQQKFVSHCSRLYNIRSEENLVNQITKEINKRDEVYEVVSQNFPHDSQQSYQEKLKSYFSEHELMAKIIDEFKAISKLEIVDLGELYYFLKSDS